MATTENWKLVTHNGTPFLFFLKELTYLRLLHGNSKTCKLPIFVLAGIVFHWWQVLWFNGSLKSAKIIAASWRTALFRGLKRLFPALLYPITLPSFFYQPRKLPEWDIRVVKRSSEEMKPLWCFCTNPLKYCRQERLGPKAFLWHNFKDPLTVLNGV